MSELDDHIAAYMAKQQQFYSDSDLSDLLGKIQNATPQQIRSYVTSNINTVADVKQLLVKVLLLLAIK